MGHLKNGPYRYREDLGGLCSIYAEYGYNIFDDLVKIISSYVKDHKYRISLLHQLELIRRHIKREYVHEICVENNGRIEHKECIDHCLPYAFGICNKMHIYRCDECSKFYSFFDELQEIISASLLELDDNGAIFIVDYKMRILPKSARETKTEFFGKHGWTLHTVLVYTKSSDYGNLDIAAYDHWSEDTKQDAWFTASSFHAVFDAMPNKPKWIIIISDNGPHYHNTEMMIILSHWKDWYNVEIKKWIFLEAEEAKTTIDSHHVQIAHAIKCYVRLGFDVTKGEDIENAGKDLHGTSISQMNPNHEKNKEQSSTTTIEKPNPQISIPSIPQSSWSVPIISSTENNLRHMKISEIKELLLAKNIAFDPNSNKSTLISLLEKQLIDAGTPISRNQNNEENIQMDAIDEDFPLQSGWTLRENQKFEKKEDELNDMANKGELEFKIIPRLETIQNWIARYSSACKREMADIVLRREQRH
ncbi:hypothetical protein GLOIN_2v1880126 [Rhizophagus clarus]|uniref:SAP domain-containing protein n=1 Tax=Rhizophagus clarus TaxID=94130 RepID=A0A8H3LJG5_9GLOM|nr:hypothetical protein GLOIN_2v1880126 [Rhizophagus clarus]